MSVNFVYQDNTLRAYLSHQTYSWFIYWRRKIYDYETTTWRQQRINDLRAMKTTPDSSTASSMTRLRRCVLIIKNLPAVDRRDLRLLTMTCIGRSVGSCKPLSPNRSVRQRSVLVLSLIACNFHGCQARLAAFYYSLRVQAGIISECVELSDKIKWSKFSITSKGTRLSHVILFRSTHITHEAGWAATTTPGSRVLASWIQLWADQRKVLKWAVVGGSTSHQ